MLRGILKDEFLPASSPVSGGGWVDPLRGSVLSRPQPGLPGESPGGGNRGQGFQLLKKLPTLHNRSPIEHDEIEWSSCILASPDFSPRNWKRRGFTGCRKTRRHCHSERSEEPLHFWHKANAEVLRRLQLLRMTAPAVFPQPVQPRRYEAFLTIPVHRAPSDFHQCR